MATSGCSIVFPESLSFVVAKLSFFIEDPYNLKTIITIFQYYY
jgi:hypothetical protein